MAKSLNNLRFYYWLLLWILICLCRINLLYWWKFLRDYFLHAHIYVLTLVITLQISLVFCIKGRITIISFLNTSFTYRCDLINKLNYLLFFYSSCMIFNIIILSFFISISSHRLVPTLKSWIILGLYWLKWLVYLDILYYSLCLCRINRMFTK